MSIKEIIQQRLQEENADYSANELDKCSEEENLEEISKNLKFFGVESIRGGPTCLDLRLADGNSKALPYSFIIEINFDSSEGIEIVTSTKKILITGRNLQMLYNYTIAFRVKYIRANIGNDLTEEKELFVKEIKIEEL